MNNPDHTSNRNLSVVGDSLTILQVGVLSTEYEEEGETKVKRIEEKDRQTDKARKGEKNDIFFIMIAQNLGDEVGDGDRHVELVRIGVHTFETKDVDKSGIQRKAIEMMSDTGGNK